MSEGESALPSQEWCDSVNTLLSQTHHSPPSLSAIGCVLCFCLRRFTLTGWIRRLVFEWKTVLLFLHTHYEGVGNPEEVLVRLLESASPRPHLSDVGFAGAKSDNFCNLPKQTSDKHAHFRQQRQGVQWWGSMQRGQNWPLTASLTLYVYNQLQRLQGEPFHKCAT